MPTEPVTDVIAGTGRLHDELQRLTGLKFSRSTVDRMVREARIPARKLPGQNGPYLFEPDDVATLAAEIRAEKLVYPDHLAAVAEGRAS